MKKIQLDRMLVLLTGIFLSGVAAWYSITGLTAIFAGAYWEIIILGAALELGKIIIASWLYRNWEHVGKIFKFYFVTALCILMLITSAGIFGFLSKAHLDQTAPSGDVVAKIERIDQQISKEKLRIDRAEKQLAQLDNAIDKIINASNRAETALTIRTKQKAERDSISREIKSAQIEIDKLQVEKLPLESQNRRLKNEVGPIRYVAELIYGEGNEKTLDSAVRIMILMLVFVIDPLAVLLIISASRDIKYHTNQEKMKERNEKRRYKRDAVKWLEENSSAVATDGSEWKTKKIKISKLPEDD
jgi:hypothetical protein